MLTRSKKQIQVPSQHLIEENCLYEEAKRFILFRISSEIKISEFDITNNFREEQMDNTMLPISIEGKCFF